MMEVVGFFVTALSRCFPCAEIALDLTLPCVFHSNILKKRPNNYILIIDTNQTVVLGIGL